jgi:hypothetical protein
LKRAIDTLFFKFSFSGSFSKQLRFFDLAKKREQRIVLADIAMQKFGAVQYRLPGDLSFDVSTLS